MDWVTVLEIAVVMFFGSWFLLIVWLAGQELLRRSEPRPESSYHTWHQRQGWPVLRHSCTVCKYQPTSQEPSAPTSSEATETPEATQHGS